MAAKETDCIKRDVCIFHKSGSVSDLCKDCGHYISEAQNTSTNSAMDEIALLLEEVAIYFALDPSDKGISIYKRSMAGVARLRQ